MRHRRTLALAALGVIIGAAAAVAVATHDRSLDRIRRAEAIRIGYAVEAPFAFLSSGNTVTGESPELARAVVARMGVGQIEWVQAEFDELIPELEAGRFDVIATGMFITPARARLVAFSQPTFHVAQGLLVRAGNPRGLRSYAQAAQMPGVRIAVLSGSIEEQILRQSGISSDRLISAPDALTGRVAVQSGLADGLALSAPTIRWIIEREHPQGLEMADPFTQPDSAAAAGMGYGAFAFRQEDRRLREAWDAAMRPLIGSPAHLEIIRPFGFSPADLPGGVTTEEVISR